MSVIALKHVIYAKKRRHVLYSLTFTGVILFLLVYFRSMESGLSQFAKDSKLSKVFIQANSSNLEIQMELLQQTRQEEKEKGQQTNKNLMNKSHQVQHLQRQLFKSLESSYNQKHILVQALRAESEISKLSNDNLRKLNQKLLYLKTKDKHYPKVPIDKYPLSPTLNIYDVTKPVSYDPNSCIRTTTPKRFIICTYNEKEDIYVSGDIHKYGQWEGAITYLLHSILKQDIPITFLDIGANIGYFSLLAAAAGQAVISVEPTMTHVQKFVSSIHENKFENNITLLNNAVSNERRNVMMDVSAHTNKGAFRLVAESEHLNINESITVKSILLNDLADLIYTPYVVLKLDIEGHECRVLERSEDIFNKFKVLLITMEWRGMQNLKSQPGVACPEQHIQGMVQMLTRRGFVPYSFINNERLDPNNNDKWDNIDVYWKPEIVKNTGAFQK